MFAVEQTNHQNIRKLYHFTATNRVRMYDKAKSAMLTNSNLHSVECTKRINKENTLEIRRTTKINGIKISMLSLV